MNVEEVLCANCSQLFNIKKCGQIYMCGDTYVCSKACSYNRYCQLKNIDPGFTRPDTWPLSKSKKSTFARQIKQSTVLRTGLAAKDRKIIKLPQQ